jgi:hypothetical protein
MTINIEVSGEARRMIDVNLSRLESSVAPLYHFHKKARPEFVTSAVYCMFKEQHFLITAKHSVQKDSHKLIIQLGEGMWDSVPTNRIVSPRLEEIDLAVIALREPLKCFQPITKDHILVKEPHESIPCRYIAVGYPGRKVESTSYGIRSIKCKLVAKECSADEYHKLEANRETSILINFKKEKMFSDAEGTIVFVNPIGMSGGALFWIHSSGMIEPKPAFLVGILTDWLKKRGEEGISSVRIGFAVELIRMAFGIDAFG